MIEVYDKYREFYKQLGINPYCIEDGDYMGAFTSKKELNKYEMDKLELFVCLRDDKGISPDLLQRLLRAKEKLLKVGYIEKCGLK